MTIDIRGAFLHADNKDYVIMKMVGMLAELMVKTNPKFYQQYVILEKGRSVLSLRLQKALYGMMKNALLFYRKLVSELQEMGFEINTSLGQTGQDVISKWQCRSSLLG